MNDILRHVTIAWAALALPMFFNVSPVAAAEEAAGEHDFRVLGAPPEVHICESTELLDLIKLTGEQRQTLAERLGSWKVEYLARQAEIDMLPADDLRGRRGWPPDRDRELNAEIVALLEDDQRERFLWVLALWNLGPVKYATAHRREYQSELKLTPDQYRELYELQTQWVQEALPYVTADGQPILGEQSRGVNYQVVVVIGTAGWRFKADRDARWSDILSTEQARRWRQIELQQLLLPQGVRFLVTGHDPPRTSGSYANFVPYFEAPAESLKLSAEQKSRLLAICTDYEKSLNPSSQPGVDREERIAALREKQKDALRQIEDVFTEEQRQRWRALLGEPTVYMRWTYD